MTEAPERIWASPGMPGYTDEPAVGVYDVEYVRADMLKGQTMSDNTDDMNDFVLLAMARDEAVSRVKELEAALPEQIEWVKRLADDLNAAEGREARLKAKLAKAVEALEKVSQLITDQYADRLYTQTGAGWEHCGDDIKEEARTTLAELTGGKDE